MPRDGNSAFESPLQGVDRGGFQTFKPMTSQPSNPLATVHDRRRRRPLKLSQIQFYKFFCHERRVWAPEALLEQIGLCKAIADTHINLAAFVVETASFKSKLLKSVLGGLGPPQPTKSFD